MEYQMKCTVKTVHSDIAVVDFNSKDDSQIIQFEMGTKESANYRVGEDYTIVITKD